MSSTLRCTRRAARPGPACAAIWLALLLCGARSTGAADRPPLIASRGDAFVAHRNGSNAWSIGSANLELVVGFDASRTLTLQQLFNPVTGQAWDITPGADVSLSAGGDRISLTSTGTVTLESAIAQSTEHGVTLTFTFESRAQRLRLSRVYACFPGSPTSEAWTRIVGTGGDGTSVSDLVLSQMTMPLGRVRWLAGLRGDSAGGDDTGAFDLTERNLEPGERIELYAEGRSTEQFVPLIMVDDDRQQFYSGLM